MSPSPSSFYAIGWDVGGWNCDKNRSSRDALVILDAVAKLIGTPCCGNLREVIESASDSSAWLASLVDLCGAPGPLLGSRVTMGPYF